MKKTKSKRLIYTRTPLQLTDLGVEVEGELQEHIQAALKPYLKYGLPKVGLGLILLKVVRKWANDHNQRS